MPDSARDPVIDALRGVALLGILAANLPFFGMPGGVAGSWWRAEFPGAPDLAAAFIIRAAFENTFILIFSFLFGYGAARQLESGNAAWFRKRLLVLAGFGIVHALLFWAGDILLAYALIGLALPAAVRWPVKRLLRAAIVLWVAAIIGNAVIGIALAILHPPLPDAVAALALFRSRDIAAMFGIRLAEWAEFYIFGSFVLAPLIAGAFFVGAAARKTFAGRPFAAMLPAAERLRRAIFWPALLSSPAYGALAVAPKQWAGGALIAPEVILRAISSPLLATLIFAATLRFLLWAADWRLTQIFALNGRMSLSVYIGQSVLMALLFHGYAVGAYGMIGPAWGLGVALAIFALMSLAAALWRRHFGQGPLEALSARLTGPRLGRAATTSAPQEEAMQGRPGQ
ncbi:MULTISPECIES: DUF418 domain-containing protein [Rhodomicrobium]|uniref:DUF418 domain-containing protein n=1 Tax=Rhodomicrobium TaxID=1068 RepID=UPI000B4A6B88|nr:MULTISPECIES: DUF418 domain-containing protein [Rhodomicrobium]